MRKGAKAVIRGVLSNGERFEQAVIIVGYKPADFESGADPMSGQWTAGYMKLVDAVNAGEVMTDGKPPGLFMLDMDRVDLLTVEFGSDS